MNKPIKWAGQLTRVREVTIRGTADLSFWKEWLMEQDLRRSEDDGKAQLLIGGADSKYMVYAFES